jgi:putative addiction module CopG family antidote
MLNAGISSEAQYNLLSRLIDVTSEAERNATRGVEMEISLPPALEQFVKEKVKAGMYGSESDVICDVLRRTMRWNSNGIASLQSQLAHLEVAIQELMRELEKKRAQEDEELDSIKDTQEKAETILSNLRKAAEAYAQIITATQLV